MKTVIRRYAGKEIIIGIINKGGVDLAQKLRAYPNKRKQLPLEHERRFKHRDAAEAYAEQLHAMIKAG